MIFIIYNFLEKITKNEIWWKTILIFLLSPIFLILEYLVYFGVWKRVIIAEIFTNDEIVAFLDKQDFEYKGNKIYKCDLLESNEFFNRVDLRAAKEIIYKEYNEALLELFKKHSQFNIENFLNLQTSVEIKFVNKNGEYYKSKVYYVSIQFCRYFFLKQIKNYVKIYFILVLLGYALIYFL